VMVLPGFYSAGGTDASRRVQQNECLGASSRTAHVLVDELGISR
jgi:hypothetical protein